MGTIEIGGVESSLGLMDVLFAGSAACEDDCTSPTTRHAYDWIRNGCKDKK